MDEAAEDEAAASSFVSSVESSVESVESSVEVEVDAAAEPPVTPWDAWPAAFLSSAMFVLSLVCSSEILSSMSDVSSPDAWACASCKCHRHIQHTARHAVRDIVRTWMFSAWISPVSLRTLFLILPCWSAPRVNSVMRSVGVPSMHECSPRKPDLPFSKTMTKES